MQQVLQAGVDGVATHVDSPQDVEGGNGEDPGDVGDVLQLAGREVLDGVVVGIATQMATVATVLSKDLSKVLALELA